MNLIFNSLVTTSYVGRLADEIKAEIKAGFSERRLSSPRKSDIAHMLRGDVQYNPKTREISETLFPPHYMICAPGVTNRAVIVTVAT